jgi:2'-5' RNA ligase
VTTNATVRCFFALWPDAAARDALAELAREVAAQARGRAPVAGNIHLTLAFLGNVTPSQGDALREVGAVASASAPPFGFTLDRVGMFRGTGIAWAGTSTPPVELARLVSEMNAVLAARGFMVDPRPFHAHVTLARRCRTRLAEAIATPIAWPVTRLVLIASDLTSGGPHYRELAGWPLSPSAAD